MENERYTRGEGMVRELYGDAGQEVIQNVTEVAPDLARYIMEFAFGDVYSRPALDLKGRQIATIASLTTLGNCPSALRAHIHGALNVGCSREEVLEIIIQMAVYAGFPAALNAAAVAKQVFAELDDPRQNE